MQGGGTTQIQLSQVWQAKEFARKYADGVETQV